MTIDTTNMCSHLQRKLFEEDGVYHRLWLAMQDNPELTAEVRSRQLHIYRNGKKGVFCWHVETPENHVRKCMCAKKEPNDNSLDSFWRRERDFFEPFITAL